MPKGKGNGESPDSSFLTFGITRFCETVSVLRHSRYRIDSIFRSIVILGFTVLFLILLNSTFPSAGELVKEYMGNQMGATFLAGAADAAAYTMELAVGATLGATAADGAALVFYKTISPYPSPDYRPLSDKESTFVLSRFRSFDPELPIERETLKIISSNLIARATAFKDVRDIFINAHILLFKGKIKALMSIPEIREYILNEVTKNIDDIDEREALFDKYSQYSHLSRVRNLGIRFPDSSFLYYGATRFYDHIKDFLDYRRRRFRAAFCSTGILSSSGSFFYGIMFALPGAEPKFEAFLANEIRLNNHILLYAIASSGVILVGGSFGAKLFEGIYSIYARCRYGVARDYALSDITAKDLVAINQNMPHIIRHEPGCTIQMRVLFNLQEVNSVRRYLVKSMRATGVDHEAALLDLLHGKVSSALMHPRTGPLLAERLVSDVETRIALLRQFGFPGHAVDTARLAVVNEMRTTTKLRKKLQDARYENDKLQLEYERLHKSNRELRASFDVVYKRERAASGELLRIQSFALEHPVMNGSKRSKQDSVGREVELRSLRRSSSSVPHHLFEHREKFKEDDFITVDMSGVPVSMSLNPLMNYTRSTSPRSVVEHERIVEVTEPRDEKPMKYAVP